MVGGRYIGPDGLVWHCESDEDGFVMRREVDGFIETFPDLILFRLLPDA